MEGRSVARKRILLVEDNEYNRDLFTQILADEFDIVAALDGATGIAKAIEERPDLILMDLGLPTLDGWEATRRIKTHHALKHIPVVAVTSHAMAGDERRARDAGCDDYLAKPIDEDELMAKIRKLI